MLNHFLKQSQELLTAIFFQISIVSISNYYIAFCSFQNCIFGCTDCLGACPEKVPVSTILRYAYYYRKQGREKHAMRKYAKLGSSNASVCLDCHAPCVGACPHGVQAQARLFDAHGLLSLV